MFFGAILRTVLPAARAPPPGSYRGSEEGLARWQGSRAEWEWVGFLLARLRTLCPRARRSARSTGEAVTISEEAGRRI